MHNAGIRPRRLIGIVLCVAAIAAASATAAQTTTPGKSFLWKVQSGSKLVYLAGSVHALSPDVYPLSPAFERAFTASDTLVEEIDLAEADALTLAPTILAKGMYLDGRRFDSVVSKETATLVAARLKEAGLPATQWYAHTDGASWDYIAIGPVLTDEQQSKVDEISKKKGRLTGFKASLQFREFVSNHTDTFVVGPVSAADLVEAGQ